jgi:hypothetical protein
MTTQLAAARARARRDFLRRERDRRRLSIAYPPHPIEAAWDGDMYVWRYAEPDAAVTDAGVPL